MYCKAGDACINCSIQRNCVRGSVFHGILETLEKCPSVPHTCSIWDELGVYLDEFSFSWITRHSRDHISFEREERKLTCKEKAGLPASLRSSHYLCWCFPPVAAVLAEQRPARGVAHQPLPTSQLGWSRTLVG